MLNHLPPELTKFTRHAAWQRNTMGMTDAAVFRLDYPDGTRHYLKTAALDAHFPLYPEYQRLVWLKGRLPVPEALYYAADEQREYLLMTEIPGLMACDEALTEILPKSTVAALLAEGLKLIHALDTSDCPFDARLDRTIAEAGYRLEHGMVDESDFDDERQGRTAASAFEELLATRPDDEDVVFTHGDYCLPNILIDPDKRRITGFIDMGRAGLADAYQDLALAERSLIYNFGAAWLPHFWNAYGITRINHDRVAFYRLLDEFF